MGIRGGSVLVPWRPAFWIAAEVVDRLTAAARRSGGAQRYVEQQGGGAWEARPPVDIACWGAVFFTRGGGDTRVTRDTRDTLDTGDTGDTVGGAR